MSIAPQNLRIGIATMGTKAWLGGVAYVELLCKAIRSIPIPEQPKVYLVFHDMTQFDLYQNIMPFANGIMIVGEHYAPLAKHLQPPSAFCPSNQELFQHIDFFFPTANHVMHGFCAGAWIPDFQHVHLPQFFKQQEIEWRNERMREIAEQAPITVFSSRDAESDFIKLCPSAKTKRWVLPFYSLPLDDWYSADATVTQHKYNLPDNYLICCNQFWAHKNHVKAFEALAILKAKGISVNLVCTGATDDPRSTDFMGFINGMIKDLKLESQVFILGMIPRADQIQLIRRAAGLMQPSLFEGWSTVVEDCRALGKTMFLSDLEVNKEQNPRFGFFFDRQNSKELAALIERELQSLKPGPDLERERLAKEEQVSLVQEYGRNFMRLAAAAVSTWKI